MVVLLTCSISLFLARSVSLCGEELVSSSVSMILRRDRASRSGVRPLQSVLNISVPTMLKICSYCFVH